MRLSLFALRCCNLAITLFCCNLHIGAQTFRGELAGGVEDASGSVVRDCQLTVAGTANGIEWLTRTGNSGEFRIPELPVGVYKVMAACPAFAPVASEATIRVSVATVLRLSVTPSPQSASITVAEPGLQIESRSSSINNVIAGKQVQDLPLNGRDFLRLLRLAPGVVLQGTSFYAVNGNRGRSNNFQIDGADNNDAWQNASAGNQGGVSAIPNTLVPIEAIDQFALQSVGNSEQGRNSGANVNLVLRSGGNAPHGSLFYFNRNEALAANSPVVPPGDPKRKIRTHQYGASLGGPVVRNKTFFFGAWEGQRLRVGNTIVATTPSLDWLERGSRVLNAFGVAENPLARNLLTMWPSAGRTAPAVANNFFNNADNEFSNDNAVFKLDHMLSSRHYLTVRYLGATGRQLAQSGSPYREYFQVAENTLHNFAASWTASLSPAVVNQFVAGVNYYAPAFNDNDRSADPVALGLNTGVTDPELRGAPTISLSGFAGVGPTQPQRRVDIAWHITDTFSWNKGRHNLRIGGEIRQSRLDVYNEINKRGTFAFDGTAGPWSSGTSEQRALGATFSQSERVMADFLTGFVSGNNGARIVRGRLGRELRQPSVDLFAHDQWQVTPLLHLNFGVRYTFVSTLSDTDRTLTTFDPDRGIIGVGNGGLDRLYPRDRNNLGPRVGFAWQPRRDSPWVLRGAYGIYYDLFQATYFLSNSPSNGGASGLNANPGGADPVFTLTRSGFQLVSGEPVFGAAQPVPPFGVYSVSQDLRLPWAQNYHLTLQRALGRAITVQAGYVGSAGRSLPLTRNINAPIPGTAGDLQSRRPYGSRFPTLGTINELQTIGSSNYNSLQTVMNVSGWRQLQMRLAWTWSKVIDYGSDARFILPANSYDLRRERGRADFDATHVFVAGASWTVPTARQLPSWLSRGWELNTFVTAHTGLPFDLRAGTNVSNSFDGADRLDVVGDPFSGIVQPATGVSRRFFNPAAFARPASGSFGNVGRNVLSGPSFASLDASLFRNIRLREWLSAQFRVEAFNVLDHTNWANPGNSLAASTTFGLSTNTRNGGSAPGIGPGEPRSIQIALKLIF